MIPRVAAPSFKRMIDGTVIGRLAPLHWGVRRSNHDRSCDQEMHGADRVPDLRRLRASLGCHSRSKNLRERGEVEAVRVSDPERAWLSK